MYEVLPRMWNNWSVQIAFQLGEYKMEHPLDNCLAAPIKFNIHIS